MSDEFRFQLTPIALTFGASRFSVTDVARWAHAFHDVIVNVAVRVTGARVLCAGILATVVDAGLVRRTVRVASASQQYAGDPRIAAETRWAFADGLVIYTVAHGVLAAGGRRACRHAVALDARMRAAAITVGSASCN